LNLVPVMLGVAKEFFLTVMDIGWNEPGQSWWFSASNWLILSHNKPFMYSPPMLSQSTVMSDQDTANPLLWTDDYASLLHIVRFRR
jgi:hypothetical protein